MSRPIIVPPHRGRALLAQRIAGAWTPALGSERAHEAANNVVTPIGPELSVSASARVVLEHRVRAFGWDLDETTVAQLVELAATVTTEHAAEVLGGS